MKRLFVLFCVIILSFPVFSDDELFDYVSLMGMDIASLIDTYGIPSSVYSVRGAEEWQDDVVFDYGAFAVFLWDNRVWQILFTDDFAYKVEGLVLGMNWDEAVSSLSAFSLVFEDDEKKVFVLPRWSYPVRLVVMKENDVLSKIYVYRSDF
ncbi:hypothetical protein WKV44_03080 [Spirochaetia bacterium 38H-sp]|uniref:Uncharacterized protein n=1 Tax=Rarispira pelagica TaxID=3141764 RepID=A0ABU9UA39_9SPIR